MHIEDGERYFEVWLNNSYDCFVQNFLMQIHQFKKHVCSLK